MNQENYSRRSILSVLSASLVGLAGCTGKSESAINQELKNINNISDNDTSRYVVGSDSYPTIQSAIDAIPVGAGPNNNNGIGEVYIPAISGTYSESIIADKQSISLEGQGINTVIEGTESHTITVAKSDIKISDIWADQIDEQREYDGVHIEADEVRLSNIDIDLAPRYGLYIDGYRPSAKNVQVQGGKTAGVFLSSDTQRSATLDFVINAPDGTGMVVNGNLNTIDTLVNNCGKRGLEVNGDGNVIRVQEYGSSLTGLRISGEENVITGRVDSDVVFTPDSSKNSLTGVVNGDIMDEGNRNDIHNEI